MKPVWWVVVAGGGLVALFIGAVIVLATLGALGVVDLEDGQRSGESRAPSESSGSDRAGRERDEGKGREDRSGRPLLRVTQVIDGDTVETDKQGRVRLIGVDTPEIKAPDQPVGCFGQEASTFAASLLPPGTTVRLVGDVEQRDRFGRLLAYVYRRSDGLFVNAELLRRGFAQVLTIPPNIAHTDEFATIARQAREASQGLWASCRLLPNGRPAPASSSNRTGAG